MSEIKNLMEDNIRNNKVAYLATFLFFSIGVVLGAYTIKYMGENNTTELNKYFSTFISSLGDKSINYNEIFLSSFKSNFTLFGIIFISGIFILGFPFLLLANLWKGYTVGFTFSFLLTTYEYKGIGLAIGAVIPQNIIIVPIMLFFSSMFLNMSIGKLIAFRNKSKKISFEIREFGNILIVFSILLGIGIFIETFVSPNLIKLIITQFYS
ncbi:stage II sporulation protein M [Clostridium sp. YIM B02551]|uniref:stage II sporulation protein M n=1 Tax=Clostridium sp. YIM B02551 TaxID=2910679 RepID=UPI001EEC335C|nr:stage II sporulation protein M [Clostridium sp. YIM B02551]